MLSYSNGTYVPTDQLAMPVVEDPLGTFRGYRIFTAMRTISGRVFHLDDHIDRIFNSARVLYMEIKESHDDLKRIVEEMVFKNKAPEKSELLVEILYSGGDVGDTALAQRDSADLYVIVMPLKLPPEEWYRDGIALATFSYQRQWPEVKLLNYVAGVIAHQTVVKQYKAVEALFVSPTDNQTILEGTTCNFFAVRDRVVITPPCDGKILKGITRKIVIDLAHKEKIAVDEDYMSLRDLESADEAFITSSTRGVVPVVRVDNQLIGDGTSGKITRLLGAAFQAYLESYKG